MYTGIGTEFHALGVQSQQRDVVVVRGRAVSLVLDHPGHFEIDVFGFVVATTVVFQKSYADIFSFESVRNNLILYRMYRIRLEWEERG